MVWNCSRKHVLEHMNILLTKHTDKTERPLLEFNESVFQIILTLVVSLFQILLVKHFYLVMMQVVFLPFSMTNDFFYSFH